MDELMVELVEQIISEEIIICKILQFLHKTRKKNAKSKLKVGQARRILRHELKP
jgi:hypothetical protein